MKMLFPRSILKSVLGFVLVDSLGQSLSVNGQCTSPYPIKPSGRCPDYQDYEDIESIIWEQILDSTCPDESDPKKEEHWDYEPSINNCEYFPRERNPTGLASRLLRHAFHDAAGHLDGHVDLHFTGNDGLDSSLHVLKKAYTDTTFTLTNGGTISEVLNMADFCVWAYIAAYRYTCARQDQRTGFQGSEIGCDIPLKYGRYSYNADTDEEPAEDFPESGANADLREVEAYFSEHFGFSKVETATIMGGHTLGMARRPESGLTGMWTDTKNQFNNEYYSIMKNPIAFDCPAPGQCTELVGSHCEEDESDPSSTGRCQGWEVQRISTLGGDGTRLHNYQWQTACRDDGTGCRLLMIHADMTLLKDLDGYICTDDEVAANDRGCTEVGQVIGWPEDSECGIWDATKRIFAKCYHDRDGTVSKQTVDKYAADEVEFLEAFAIVYQKMLEHRNPLGWPALQSIEMPEPEELSVNGDPCPTPCTDVWDTVTNPFNCGLCQGGKCGLNPGGSMVCKPPNWQPKLRKN